MNNIADYEGSLRTDKSGKLSIYTKAAFDQYFLDNPNGAFTMKIQKVSQNNQGRTVAYYVAEVLTKIVKGFEAQGDTISKEEAMDYLKNSCKVNRKTYIDENDKIKHMVVDFTDLEYFEKRRHISEAIIIAAQDLGVIIEEPI